jgi:hypothetical protein
MGDTSCRSYHADSPTVGSERHSPLGPAILRGVALFGRPLSAVIEAFARVLGGG